MPLSPRMKSSAPGLYAVVNAVAKKMFGKEAFELEYDELIEVLGRAFPRNENIKRLILRLYWEGKNGGAVSVGIRVPVLQLA